MINILTINEHLKLGTLDLGAFSLTEGLIEKRELEKKGTLALLKKLFPDTEVKLAYTGDKKPYLQDNDCHISISHSHDKLAVLANTKESTGVDVELIREKVIHIKNKFLCLDELVRADDNVELLTTLWAAKECVFKAYGIKGVNFARDIFIESFHNDSDNFYGHLETNSASKKYLLKKEKHGDYILVYILNEV